MAKLEEKEAEGSRYSADKANAIAVNIHQIGISQVLGRFTDIPAKT